jgi:hypothetical protein
MDPRDRARLSASLCPPGAALPRGEHFAQFGAPTEAVFRVLFKQRRDEFGEEGRRLDDRRGDVVEMGVDGGGRVLAAKRVGAGRKLVQDDAERVQIRRRPDFAPAALLRRRIVQ